jgi:glutamate carboxypeptidase
MRTPDPVAELAARLASEQSAMVAALRTLVCSESPSNHPELLESTAGLVADLGNRLLGTPAKRLGDGAAPALHWHLPGVHCEAPPVLVLAHLDTVWPAGTLARWPFTVTGDRASGPGAFDMKAGLVQALFALSALDAADLPRPAVAVLVTADEEVGSPHGRALVEECAREAGAVLVVEPSSDGALKVARKGVANYSVHVTGRAAHAGLEPDKGVNALVGAAHLVVAVEHLADPAAGTTVTPTMATAGSSPNTVPSSARVAIDVRAATVAEQQRVDKALRDLRVPGEADVRVEGGINRAPMEEAAAEALYLLAKHVADRCGLPPLRSARVGGGSDGNFTAALGIPTLDGLGAVGAGAHAEGEYIVVPAMPQRAALLAGLIVELGKEPR